MFTTSNNQTILSVTKLNRFAKRVLESEIGLVWVTGEISNFVRAASGHWYFSLKDDNAQVKSAMFKGSNQRTGFTPKNGDKVMVRASLSIYEPRGDYQLIVQHMEPDGIGLLKQQFEALKQQLTSEGLFDQSHKRSIPKTISTVGVITSPTGAAIHDILHVLARRNPSLRVILYPASVQGRLAAAEIKQQIETANQRNEVDVLIVGRGGGSLEDLWPFNEESVARAIFHSQLPVISAVGHETDITISDFVADQRAPTPSAAAELVSMDKRELLERLAGVYKYLTQHMQTRLRQMHFQIQMNNQRLSAVSPTRSLEKFAQRIDTATLRLRACHPLIKMRHKQEKLNRLQQDLWQILPGQLVAESNRLASLYHRLLQQSPQKSITQQQQQLQHYTSSIHKLIQQALNSRRNELASKSALLDSVSPLGTLKRGYSITYDGDSIINTTDEVKVDSQIRTKFIDGDVYSIVNKIVKSS